MSVATRLRSQTAPPSMPTLQARTCARDPWMVDVALLAPLLLAAFGLRLVNLGVYSGLFDEGIRAEQLYLMSRGFRPFKQIFAAPGPLLLDALYPLYALFGAFVGAP